MRTHDDVDKRSIRLAEAVVRKIDTDTEHWGIEKARLNCQKWLQNGPSHALLEWLEILNGPGRYTHCVTRSFGKRLSAQTE
jgi:hypothetical protein